jgi:hypothetical protein
MKESGYYTSDSNRIRLPERRNDDPDINSNRQLDFVTKLPV